MYAVRLNATQPFFDRLAKDFPNLKQHHLDDSYYGFLVAELHTATFHVWKLFQRLVQLNGPEFETYAFKEALMAGYYPVFQVFKFNHWFRSLALLSESNDGLSKHLGFLRTMRSLTADNDVLLNEYRYMIRKGESFIKANKERFARLQGDGRVAGLASIDAMEQEFVARHKAAVLSGSSLTDDNPLISVSSRSRSTLRSAAQRPVSLVPPTFSVDNWRKYLFKVLLDRAAGRRVRPAGRVRRPAAAGHRGDPRVARAQDVQRGLHRGDRAALVPGLGRVHDGGRGADGGAVSVRDVRRGGGLETDGEPGFRAVGRSPQRKLDGHFLPVGLGARAQQAPQRQAAAGGVLRDESGRADLRNTRLSAVRGRVAAGADGPDRQGVHPAVCGVRQGLHGVWDEQLRQELSAVHWQQHCGVRARRFRVQLSLVEGVAQLALPQSVQADAAAQGAGAGRRRADRRDGDARVLQPAVCGVCVQQQHGQAVRDARVSGELLDPADGAEQPGAHSGDAPVGDGDSDELAGDSHGTAAGGAAAQLFCRQVPAAARGFRKAAGGAGRVPAELL
ncbi:hypothetical protein KL921_001683 [Ogataea angusta]|nr:hypothetical protein KL921_001683 [Ogataea angusta]